MSDDLISRKALMQCYTGTNGYDDKASYASIRKMAEIQPVAYDVDKVVEQIEDVKQQVERNILLNSHAHDLEAEVKSEMWSFNRCIELIKAGGKDNE